MTDLDIFGKLCNRWPGHSKCLKSIQGGTCDAEVDNESYKVKCVSGQKRKGIVPVELILSSKKIIPEKSKSVA